MSLRRPACMCGRDGRTTRHPGALEAHVPCRKRRVSGIRNLLRASGSSCIHVVQLPEAQPQVSVVAVEEPVKRKLNLVALSRHEL